MCLIQMLPLIKLSSVHLERYRYHYYTASSLVSQVNGEESGENLSAYCSSPETVFGAAYVAILPSHRLLHGRSSVRSALEKAFQPGKGEHL